MRWQCEHYIIRERKRCEAPAEIRVHFQNDHPFDHMDVCMEHFKECPKHKWAQSLNQEVDYEDLRRVFSVYSPEGKPVK